MGLESGNYISDLTATNPLSGDDVSAGDDHLRLIKSILQKSFPGFASSIIVTGADGGAADAYTMTPATACPGYVEHMLVVLEPANANTGTSTLNISSLGAKTIKTATGANLGPGNLQAGARYLLVYDGTDFRMVDSSARQMALFRNVQTSGTGGGQASGGSADTFYQCPLNTTEYNTINGASLGSNSVNLPAGTYRVSALQSSGSGPQWEKMRLYNSSDTAVIDYGEIGEAGANHPIGLVDFVFTLTAAKNIDIWVSATGSFTPGTQDFGATTSSGVSEVYAALAIERLY